MMTTSIIKIITFIIIIIIIMITVIIAIHSNTDNFTLLVDDRLNKHIYAFLRMFCTMLGDRWCCESQVVSLEISWQNCL